INLADYLNMEIELLLQEGYEAEIPNLEGKFTQWGIVEYRRDDPSIVTVDGKKLMRYRFFWKLEPFVSGKVRIEPLTFRFATTASAAKGEWPHHIESEPVEVEVTPISDQKDLTFHDIPDPILPPAPSHFPWQWFLLSGTLLLLLAAGAIVLWRRRSQPSEPPPPDPAMVAFAAMQRLVDEKVLDREGVKPFYQGLSAILRHYIENRFGINAPDLTTEEFLHALRTQPVLDDYVQSKLKKFLTLCDLVKFAEYKPRKEDVEETFRLCREIIELSSEQFQQTEESEDAV
ncbi:MAG: DUF4381 family protein, partial [Lentisphaerae bacterium]